ncbi:carboxypeptidase-like regulatory domain-containing protein [Membranicola marinus]|uniref:Carboxypeptidase-like regulatory domain-containing protein n=1 Tax=Membranihabitans marinus TaxID=1227546 RepID=A0A953HSP4_9BACT|nr:carboxypeptidase-like regulatory domain-containing protein [Membranihabitans marinus]MBY5960233.1 carboxypeptidase-like regulatory domain-containing protein [Membranihabitans marinus]
MICNDVEPQINGDISGRLLSADDHNPVAYATIIDVSSYENGTTSDKNGKFFLVFRNASNTSVKLKISCIGYQDTIVSVSTRDGKKLEVLLQKRAYALPEVTIRGESMAEHIIGIPGGTILKNKNGELTGLIPSNSAGFSCGVFIKIPGKKVGVLKSIEYFILSRGKPEAPFMLRFLKAKEPVLPNRMYTEDMFTDLMKEPIVTSGQSGWNTVSLLDYNISLPHNELFILFTPLESGDEYKWMDNGKEWYGMVLGRYEKKRVRGLYWAIRAKGTYSYDDTPFRQNITPAIVLNYLSE